MANNKRLLHITAPFPSLYSPFLHQTLGLTRTLSPDEMLILGEFLSGPRVAGDPAREGGDFPGCKIQLSSG